VSNGAEEYRETPVVRHDLEMIFRDQYLLTCDNFALQIVVFSSKHTVPVIINAHCAKNFKGQN